MSDNDIRTATYDELAEKAGIQSGADSAGYDDLDAISDRELASRIATLDACGVEGDWGQILDDSEIAGFSALPDDEQRRLEDLAVRAAKAEQARLDQAELRGERDSRSLIDRVASGHGSDQEIEEAVAACEEYDHLADRLRRAVRPQTIYDQDGNEGELLVGCAYPPAGCERAGICDWSISGGASLERSTDWLTADEWAGRETERRATVRDEWLASDAVEGRYEISGSVRGLVKRGSYQEAALALLDDQDGCELQGGYCDADIMRIDRELDDERLAELREQARDDISALRERLNAD